MRHGQTNYNLQGLCSDDPTKPVFLTDEGLRQAQEGAEKLRDTPIEKIYTSQLPRTQQTAEAVNRYHNVPIEARAEINDIRTGYDSRPIDEYMQAIAHDPLHASAENGESQIQHKDRIVAFIHWLESQPLDHVLVVAHEETLRVFTAHFRGYPAEHLRQMSFANCEILEFEP